MEFLYLCLCRRCLYQHVFLLCFFGSSSCSIVLSYYDLLFIYLSCFIAISWYLFYFLRRERNGVNLDGRQGREDLGGVGEWENTIRI